MIRVTVLGMGRWDWLFPGHMVLGLIEMNGPLLSSLLGPDVILGKPAFSCASPSSSPSETACDLIICASFISAWQLLEALTMSLHQMTHQIL